MDLVETWYLGSYCWGFLFFQKKIHLVRDFLGFSDSCYGGVQRRDGWTRVEGKLVGACQKIAEGWRMTARDLKGTTLIIGKGLAEISFG